MASPNSEDTDTVDAVHMKPEELDMHGRITPSRFDTVLVHEQDQTNRNKGEFVDTATLRTSLMDF